MQSAVTLHQRVDLGIIQFADDDFDGIAENRVYERANLPCAKVRGEEQDTSASLTSGCIVFKSIIKGDAACVFGCVAGKHAKLSEVAAKANEQLTNNSASLPLLHLRKRNLQIALANSSQTPYQNVRCHS